MSQEIERALSPLGHTLQNSLRSRASWISPNIFRGKQSLEHIREPSAFSEEMRNLIRAVSKNTLRQLVLRQVVVDPQTLAQLFDELPASKTVKEIKFDGTKIPQSAVESFSQALSQNSSITSLHLVDCALSSQSIEKITAAMASNSYLSFMIIFIFDFFFFRIQTKENAKWKH